MNLSWVVVKDIEKAIEFYTKVMGLKLAEFSKEHNWAEFEGHDGGPRLGACQPYMGEKPGQNAVVTLDVDDIVAAKKELQAKGVECLGDIVEVPGHVKMQTIQDKDGNTFQIVQMLSHSH